MWFGYIEPGYYLGGQDILDVDEALTAVDRISGRIGISRTDAADGIFRIINTNMLNGIRVVSVEKGNDPRDFSLLSFGGAGACHATAIIEELEIDRVIVPPTAAAFSAFGLLCTDLRRDFVTTIYSPWPTCLRSEIKRGDWSNETAGKGGIPFRGTGEQALASSIPLTCDTRGQGHDIRVVLPGPVSSLSPADHPWSCTTGIQRAPMVTWRKTKNISAHQPASCNQLPTKEARYWKHLNPYFAKSAQHALKERRPVYFNGTR